MGRISVKDCVWISLVIFWVVLPPEWDPMIRAKDRLEHYRDEPEWGPDRGFSVADWSLFVAAIALVVMLAVVFAIAISS